MRLFDALAGELHLLDSSLCGGQTGDGHTEGGAGNIVQTHTVAELHRGGIAAVLTADAQMQVGVSGTAQLGSCLLYKSPSPRDCS